VRTALLPQEQDEIGHPALSKQATTTVASGRVAAWEGALEQIGDRPILGYGFGTEQKVFLDRWYYFQGGSPENSYLGLLLQVGALGLALVLAMGLALVVGGFRALRVVEGDDRILVVASLGVIVAAAAIMLIQSYLYSVGNIASTTVWIAMFVLSPIALAPRAARAHVRAAAREGMAA
jgi:O-antigen ligase